jgi:hypothetical protein
MLIRLRYNKYRGEILMVNPANPNPATAPAAPGTVHKPTAVASGPAATPATTSGNGQPAEGEKPKKKAKEKTGVARPRLARPDENHVITVLRPGAKTGKSGERYDQVRTGMTVKEYVELMTKEPFNRTVGQAYHTLRWDTDPNRKLLNIGPTVVPIPEPAPPKEKAKAKDKEAKEPANKPAA